MKTGMVFSGDKMDLFLIRLKQRVPLGCLDYNCLQLPLSESCQDGLLTTLNEIANTNGYYSVSVVKKLIDLFESCDTMEINEEFYEFLMEKLQCRPLQPTDTDIITYTFQNGLEVRVRESPNLISGLGTTGLRTWEASLYLADYLMRPDVLASIDADVLELGCGTGMVSISMLKNRAFHSGKLFITDGDSQLMERVNDNIKLNIDTSASITGNPNYEIRKLWWGEDYIPDSVHTVLAADVTYDASIIPDLINVFNEGMSQGHVSTALVAATKRNEDTLAVWERWLDMGKSDGIWTWSITSVFRPDKCDLTISDVLNANISTLFYGPAPSEIFIYRLDRVSSGASNVAENTFREPPQ